MIIAANIHNALAEADPGNADEYKMNLGLLLRDLSALDNKINRLLQPLQGRDFFVFHPSFGYFAHDYGLNQVAVEIEGKSPTPRQIEYLIEQAQAAGVKIIFVQPQFDPRSSSVIADSIQGTVISLNPLAYDLIENFEDMAVKIEKALTR
ncbi:High-affinity zinc uptake system protein ZnuA [subsurface metagenome]